MSTPVIMPQMGESVAEGTIVRWIKKVGDTIDRDEPLFEISTDKVDAEIPSPAAGVITEIRAKEGETVPVNSVVAVIAQAGAGATAAARPAKEPVRTPPAPPELARTPAAVPQADGTPSQTSAPSSASPTPPAPQSPRQAPAGDALKSGPGVEDALRQRSSPLVRRIAKEH